MLRKIVLAFVIIMLAVLCALHHHGRTKGGYVPLIYVVSAVLCAVIAALICLRFSRTATPFVAGIAGAFGIIDPFSGPYGGVLGLLAGLLVLLATRSPRRISN